MVQNGVPAASGFVRSETGGECVVEIPAGVSVDAPFIIVLPALPSTRIRVVAHAGASVTVVEEREVAEGEWEHAVDITLEEGAAVSYVSVLEAASPCRITQQSQGGGHSRMHWHNITLGGAGVQHSLVSGTTGEDAESSVDWAFFAAGAERQDLRCRNVFAGRNGRGEVLMKGVAAGKAHVKAAGRIEIGQGGGGTDTYLTQDVLMLDTTAKVDAVPGLEIKTNDVKASHSAAVSRVTADDLFYFATRCIDVAEARRLFIQGFLGELAMKLPKGVAEKVTQLIEEKQDRAV